MLYPSTQILIEQSFTVKNRTSFFL